MTRHIVQPGECLRSIADQHGWSSWRRLWEHPANEALRARRARPEVLLPGDEVEVPDEPAPAAHQAELGRETPLDVGPALAPLILTLRGSARALADRPFAITVDGRTIEGRTDGDGRLEVDVPVQATVARLTVWLDEACTSAWRTRLDIGHLDPHDTTSGVQGRLRALGFDPGPVDGEAGPRTEEALRAFQREHDLTETGEADEATRARLLEVHGS